MENGERHMVVVTVVGERQEEWRRMATSTTRDTDEFVCPQTNRQRRLSQTHTTTITTITIGTHSRCYKMMHIKYLVQY